ncbi:asparaginase [Agrococcus sp. SGAir0287]|uniref:asparaginase n=1 Tax=Agrococcus sp. SGAir0287 TaxID=2070347 RepID=UPI001586D0AA|nr:asparaginase [Agrococcus sp. SGAir0287]
MPAAIDPHASPVADLRIAATAPIAVVDRDGFVESRHEGIVAMVAPDGSTLVAAGDVDAPFLARSALKPLFAATIAERLGLAGPELALASGSIVGRAEQVEVATAMAARLGVDAATLRCPPRRTRWMDAPSRLGAICVGKHVAVAAAAALVPAEEDGADRAYTDPAHPIQVELRAAVEQRTGVASTATATDGCSAPVYASSVLGMARAVRGLAGDAALGAVGAAMREHAWLVEGPGAPDTVLMERLGVTAKFGAEGTAVVVAPDGTAVVVKVADGSRRPGAPVALALLEQAGAIPSGSLATVAPELGILQHGGSAVVGSLRPLL